MTTRILLQSFQLGEAADYSVQTYEAGCYLVPIYSRAQFSYFTGPSWKM